MRDDGSVKKRVRRRTSRNGYLLTWSALAACAVGYLAVAAAKPGLLATVLPMPAGSTSTTFAVGSLSDITEELATLRYWMSDMRRDMADTKAALNKQSVRSDGLEQRIAAAETRASTTASSRGTAAEADADKLAAKFAAAEPKPSKTAPGGSSQASTQTSTKPVANIAPRSSAAAQDKVGFEQTIAAAIEPSKVGPGVRIINAAPSSTITTGSIQPQRTTPPAFPPAKVKPAPQAKGSPAQPQAIEIARAESLDALRRRWSQIRASSPNLRSLAPRYRITADGAGGPFKLLAGPFNSSTDAARTCRTLKSRGIPCNVGDYTGNTL